MEHKTKLIIIGLVVVSITAVAIYVLTRPKKSDPKPVVGAVQKSSKDTVSDVISAGNKASVMLASGTPTEQVKTDVTKDLVNAAVKSQTTTGSATNTLSKDDQNKVAPVIDSHNAAVTNVVSNTINKINNNIDSNTTPTDAAKTINEAIAPAVQQIKQITKTTTDNLTNTIATAPAKQQTPAQQPILTLYNSTQLYQLDKTANKGLALSGFKQTLTSSGSKGYYLENLSNQTITNVTLNITSSDEAIGIWIYTINTEGGQTSPWQTYFKSGTISVPCSIPPKGAFIVNMQQEPDSVIEILSVKF